MDEIFKNNKAYQPSDPEMSVFGGVEALNQWRHRRCGPAYYKIGRKVLYSGSDLNAWIAARRVEPQVA